MSKIKLANLTPEVYYKESRDFQFIGRLYDTVLNSVKTNAEDIYYLPISENSDEKLVDLMTLTLGFKSRHNYNVKQLTSLCSAFATIIRNKGNIESIILAARSLLQAEGIDEDVAYTFGEFDKEITNRTILNLFIPEKLTDINLLRDLLIYILPAGMSCNLIREFRLNNKSTTELTTSDLITIYEGTYSTDSKQLLISADTNAKGITPKVSQGNLINAYAESTPGLLMNGDIYRPTKEDSTNYPLTYNIIYVTNGGKIINTANTKDSYTYKLPISTGTSISLPQDVQKGKDIGTETSPLYEYSFSGWWDNDSFTGTKLETLDENYLKIHIGDITLYAKLGYAVVFNLNGKSGVRPTNQIYKDNYESGKVPDKILITKPEDPKAKGYTFKGWYKEPECTNAWNFDVDSIKDTSSKLVTLYAKWE